MLYQSVLAAGLVATAFSGPLSSCYDQANCLDFTTTELAELDEDGNTQYEICMIYNDQLGQCDKDGPISHACAAGEDGIAEEGDKTEDWSAGTEGALCDIIPCSSHTTFGVKDGRSCEQDQFLYFQYYNDSDIIRCFDEADGDEGFSCGSQKQKKACKWLVLSPECEEDATTQMPEDPDTTTPADEPDTTTAADEPECVLTIEDCMDSCMLTEETSEAQQAARDCCGALAPCCEWRGGMCLDGGPTDGDAVYIRDPQTDGNMNEDLVIPEEIMEEDAQNSLVTTAPEEESDGNMVKIGFGVVMAIFAYLF